ncbi:class I SAM-dependent methyltransferase [Streptomyces meridianus]|uniref:Methyltransferase domain-containing protein n=1 Tax=Streptomyces meridianus TaxID=2938945 RepID=A0ABT0X2W4_9ACTN|nr:class I SAM-dependent methyltransferase [Streptomyces meridianus]MCM2576881.1 methyltransferase domain-containing protein [Streptomyces meridianus]
MDRGTGFLAGAAGPRLTVLEGDVSSPAFASGRFDLVHARFLLMHLRGRAEVMRRLAAAVAPGGVLVLSDAIDLTTEDAPDSDDRSAMLAMWQALRGTIGTDNRWVPESPGLLHAAGLTDIGAEVHVPPLTADEPIARFWPDTWARIRPSMPATGLVTDEGIDAAVRALGSRSFAGMSPGMITAWGRRPA